MKKLFNFSAYAILLACVLVFTACSIEDPVDLPLEYNPTLTANSAASQLMQRTVSNDGSYDNIIDGSSCFDIRFPYTVMVNGLEITIDSKDDLEIIEELFDAIDSDNDILDILFPITITKADYTDLVINSSADLQVLAEQCIEGGGDDDIECIDVVYPVTLFTYNPNLEQTGSVTVNSDEEMKRFFAGLTETDLISFDFPLVFEMFDGTALTVNNNSELANAIEGAKETCDEDDDNDHNDDDFNKEELDSYLVMCPWLIDEIKIDNLDITEQYRGYVLNFKEDGSVIARDISGNMLAGEWSTSISDYKVKLVLKFEALVDFSLEWFVYDLDEGRIKFYVDDHSKIIMKKVCGFEECSEAFITDTLQNCVWAVSNGESASFLDMLRIDFSYMNIHVKNPNEIVVDEGNWDIYGTTITFNALSMEMANYIGEWEIIECSAVRFKMKRGEEYLVLEKDCE